jgi:hypothetical protein
MHPARLIHQQRVGLLQVLQRPVRLLLRLGLVQRAQVLLQRLRHLCGHALCQAGAVLPEQLLQLLLT